MTSDDKALVERLRILPDGNGLMYKDYDDVMQAADLIEQHEAFRQEVSDAVEAYLKWSDECLLAKWDGFDRFIIAKLDPLADAVESVLSGFEGRKHAESYANQIRAALAARGLEIREKGQSK